MQLSRRTWILGGLSLLTLSGCSSLPLNSAECFSGRFSGRFERDGKTESLTGRYRYTVSGSETVLDLLTPLYGVLARVVIDKTGATLQKGEEIIARADSAQSLMLQSVGFALPVEMLQSWLAGTPQAGRSFSKIDDNGFEQAGWRILVKRRHTDLSPATISVTALQYPYIGTSLTLTVEKE